MLDDIHASSFSNRRGALHRRTRRGLINNNSNGDSDSANNSPPVLPIGPNQPVQPGQPPQNQNGQGATTSAQATTPPQQTSTPQAANPFPIFTPPTENPFAPPTTSTGTSTSSQASSPPATSSLTSTNPSSQPPTSSSSSVPSTSSTATSSTTSSTTSSVSSVPLVSTPTPTLPGTNVPTTTGVSTSLSPGNNAGGRTVAPIGGGVGSSSSAAPSPSTSAGAASASGGVSTGVLVGGIVAGIVGVAGILFAIIYFMRRSNRDDGDLDDFNATAFRRQSAVLADDDPMRQRSINRGNSRNAPRPPTMIENKYAHGAASFGAGAGAGAGASSPMHPPMPPMQDMYADNGAYYGAYAQPSFTPGQIVSMPMHPGQAVSPPPMNPFYAHVPGAYGAEGAGSPFEDSAAAHGQMLARQPSNGSAQVLTRQPSFGANQVMTPGMAQAHYVDLSRSSVTPFQAVQYAEISRRLNTAPPGPLPLLPDHAAFAAAAEEDEHTHYQDPEADENVRPLDVGRTSGMSESPFADPRARAQGVPGSPSVPSTPSAHDDEGFATAAEEADYLPQPPQRSFSGRSRVPSNPPTLPQLSIHDRPFSPVSYEFPASSTTVPKPSPLAAEVTHGMPAVPPAVHTSAAAVGERKEGVAVGAKRPDTVYTMYDDEDAYGGI